MPRYWSLTANPKVYNVRKALADGEREFYWTSKKAKMGPGDGVVIWKAKGKEETRGVVALGEVLEPPVEMELPDDEYWTFPMEKGREPRVKIRVVLPPSLPLWVENDTSGVLRSLAVSRATGGTVHKVTSQQWRALLDAVGGWPRA